MSFTFIWVQNKDLWKIIPPLTPALSSSASLLKGSYDQHYPLPPQTLFCPSMSSPRLSFLATRSQKYAMGLVKIK